MHLLKTIKGYVEINKNNVKNYFEKLKGGEKMVETQQASGGGLVGFAIIFLIILLLFPAFAIWLLYVAIVVMLIAGLVSLIAG